MAAQAGKRAVVVAGGANIDVGGRADGALVARDSNPGQVRVSLGGVGRNIAHDLALLGCQVHLLTALGDDPGAQRITESCDALGIDLTHALRLSGGRTSTYLYIAGADGDMALAVSDMAVCRALTPAYFQARRELLDAAEAVVLDANLPCESIRWLCENVRAPLFADPVSTAKGAKFGPVLGALHTLKPNRLEAQALSGVPLPAGAGEEALNRAAQALLATGLSRVFLTLGGEGVLAADHTGALRLSAPAVQAANATGAGDAFMAGLVWAHLEGAGLARAARLAQAAAAIALEGEETINPALSPQAVLARAFPP